MERSGSLRSMSEASDLSSQFEAGGEQNDNHKRNKGDSGGEDIADDEQAADFITGIWGVIYTVSREKRIPKLQVAFKLVLDCLQLLLLIVNPVYGWAIDGESTWWYVVSFVGLNNFMRDRGLTFFLACLYIFVVLLLMTAALCVWVAYSFKGNRFDHVWPITFLRWFSNIFFQILDIASMTLFLMPMDCQYTADPPMRYHNQQFPTIQCWSMPFMIHVVVSALSVILFMTLATAFQMGDMETDPTTRNPLAVGHSRVEVIGFLMKFFLTASGVFITNLKWLSICYVLGSLVLVYMYTKWVPHYVDWVNHIRCGSYGAVLYSAIVMAAMSWQNGVDITDLQAVNDFNKSCTIALIAGLVPAALLAAGGSYLRLRWLLVNVVNKFRYASPEADPTLIHEFSDPREVEVCVRTLRSWVRVETGAEMLEPSGVELADAIVKTGVTQFKGNAYIYILHASFLADVRKSLQSSMLQLMHAKKSQPSLLERFAIFSREQQQVQTDAHGSDLLSYVQMQRNLRLATKVYRDALLAMADFWNILLRHEVQFEELLKCVEAVDTMVSNADTMYRDMLQSTVDNWRILKVYAKFLEVIKNDPWGASKWNAEADDLCRAEEEGQQNVLTDASKDGKVDERSAKIKATFENHHCAIIINSFGVVTMANKAAFSLFGCKPTDMIGKNVKMLMPSPWKEHHDQFIKTYSETGRARILGHVSEFVAQHYDGHLFPVTVTVTKVSGAGMDSSFMGVIQTVPKDSLARAWMSGDGSVMCIDDAVVSWFGYTSVEMRGSSFLQYITNTEVADRVLQVAREAIASRHATSGSQHDVFAEQCEWHVNDVSIRHKFLADPVVCDIKITTGGAAQPFLILGLTRTSAEQPLVVTDASGRLVHVAEAFAESVGSTVKQIMAQGSLLSLIPEALAQLHATLLLKNTENVEAPHYSCRSGLSVGLNVTGPAGPDVQPFKLQIRRRVEEADGTMMHIVTLDRCTMQKALSERCLSVLVDMRGVVRKVSDAEADVFNFPAAQLVDTSVSDFIDVLADEGSAVLPFSQDGYLAEVMKALVTLSVERHGCSFRVGVMPPASTNIMDGFLADIASHLRSTVKKPAVMKVKVHCMNKELMRMQTEAAGLGMDDSMFTLEDLTSYEPEAGSMGEFMLELQLWKADLITGMVQLDDRGTITSAAVTPLFPGGLVFGASPSTMVKSHISEFLPVADRPVNDLFDHIGGRGGVFPKKSGLKVTKDALQSRKAPGVVNQFVTAHKTDGRELAVQVQAVMSRGGPHPLITLIIHLHNPTMGMPDFGAWLSGSSKLLAKSPLRALIQVPPAAPEPPRAVISPRLLRPASVSPAPTPMASKAVTPHAMLASLLGDEVANLGAAGLDALQVKVPALDAQDDMRMETPALTQSIKKKKKIKSRKSSSRHLVPEQTGEASLEDTVGAANGSGSLGKARSSGAAAAASLDGVLKQLVSPAALPDDEAPLKPQGSKQERVKAWINMDPMPNLPHTPDEPMPLDLHDPWRVGTRSTDLRDIARSCSELSLPLAADDLYGNADLKVKTYDNDACSNMGSSAAGQPDPFGATGSTSDYKRAKRYKRLCRLLTGSSARQIVDRFYIKAIATALVVAVITVACFVVAYTLILGQSTMVKSIQTIGFAANWMGKTAMRVNYLLVLFENNTQPGMVGLESFDRDVPFHLERLVLNVEQFTVLHRQAYDYVRNLPDDGSDAWRNLNQLWNEPNLPLTTIIPSNPTMTEETVNVTLWDAGQTVINKALNVWQKSPTFPKDVPFTTTFREWADVRFILDNIQDTLIPAYTETMDNYLAIVLEQAKGVNQIHYYFLVIEGCVASFIALLVMLVITTQIVIYRYNIYSTFMMLPTAVIRGLASRVLTLLEDGMGDEAGGAEPERAEELPSNAAPDMGLAKPGAVVQIADPGPAPGMNIMDKATMQDMSVWGVLKDTWRSMKFWRKDRRVHSSPLFGKRTLVRSSRLIIWFMVPFGIWGLMMIVINVIAHGQLALVDSPIALFNLVNYNLVQHYRSHVLLQGLTIEPDPAHMPNIRMTVAEQLSLRLSDYAAMLNGRDTVNDTRDHIKNVRDGLVNTDFGKKILFETTECLRVNQSSCVPPEHRLYGFMHHGLDAMFNRYWEVLRVDLSHGGVAPWFDSLEFEYVDTIYQDIEGGLIQLCDSYYQYVLSVYQGVMRTHVVGLVVTLVLMLGFALFMLRPFIKSCRSEGKRIADLLSQVPTDIDVEGLVKKALASGTGSPAAGNTSMAQSNRHLSVRQSGDSTRLEKSGTCAFDVAGVENSFFKPGRKGSASVR